MVSALVVCIVSVFKRAKGCGVKKRPFGVVFVIYQSNESKGVEKPNGQKVTNWVLTKLDSRTIEEKSTVW